MLNDREIIQTRVSKEVKAAAEALAMAEERSLSSLTKLALVHYLETKGKLPHRNGASA